MEKALHLVEHHKTQENWHRFCSAILQSTAGALKNSVFNTPNTRRKQNDNS